MRTTRKESLMEHLKLSRLRSFPRLLTISPKSSSDSNKNEELLRWCDWLKTCVAEEKLRKVVVVKQNTFSAIEKTYFSKN